MRNGHFIEYSLDSEGKDETCSIISSHQHLPTGGDYFLRPNPNHPTEQNNCSTSAINQLNRINNNLDQIKNDPSYRKNLNPIDSPLLDCNRTENNTTNSIGSGVYLRQTSPNARCGRSNSMISSNGSSSFSKPTVTSTTTTTSSSLSSYMFTNQQQQQQQPPLMQNSFSTKTSTSSFNEMSNNLINDDSFIANIYWPFRNCSEIHIRSEQTAFDVIKLMLTSQIYAPIRLININSNDSVPNLPLPNHATLWAYALRLICRQLNPNEHIWIHHDKNMHEFIHQHQTLFEKGWKIELRIRYVPFNLEELYKNDYHTFKFLYEQILEEYLSLELSSKTLLSNQDLLLELGCYEIFRTHPYLTSQGLEKSSNWEVLENDFHRIFPISYTNSIKVSIFLFFYFVLCSFRFFLFQTAKTFKKINQNQI